MSGETPAVREALAVYEVEAPETERVPPGYKQTEVGVIPEDWHLSSIIEFAEIIDGDRGLNYPTVSDFSYDGDCLFLNAGNVTKKGFRFSECLFVTKEKDSSLGKGKLNRWDIVLTTRGTVGNVAFYDNFVPFDDIRINSGMVILRNKNQHLDNQYLYTILRSEVIRTQVDKVVFGSAQPQLTVGVISKFKIIVPPLPEQRAIAAALSDVDDLISALDKLIAKKRAVKSAAMQQLLTGKQRLPGFSGEWEEKPLGEVAHVNMGQSPSSRNYNVSGAGLPLIQGNADIEDRKTIARVWTTQVTKLCDEGDVVLTVRAPVGYVGIASTPSCLGRGVCSVKPTNVGQKFLFHALVHAEAKWKILEQGSTFTSANSDQISKFRILCPKFREEQTTIAAVLSDMDAEIEALEARREKTRQVKQGMMQELLTGSTRLV